MHLLAALNFPPIGELVDWKAFGPLGFNKTALVSVLAAAIPLMLFFLPPAGSRSSRPVSQNLAEIGRSTSSPTA